MTGVISAVLISHQEVAYVVTVRIEPVTANAPATDRAEDGTPLLDDDFLVLVNSWWEPLEFTLPDTRSQARWRVEIDSYDPASQAGTAAAEHGAGDQITVGPRSVVVLKSPLARAA
jgi:pullulanase/glycogen debranching enzyme